MRHLEAVQPITLHQLLGRVGPSLLRVCVAVEDVLSRQVRGLQLVDPLADTPAREDHLLLVLGVSPTDEVAEAIVDRAITGGAVGLIVQDHAPIPSLLVTRAASAVALLVTRTDVSWDHLQTILRQGLEGYQHEELGGVPAGDLFGFANALAARINAAVTIEDPQSHVLAYSTIHDDLDEPRRQTILGRRVPDRYTRRISDVLRELQLSDAVIDVPADPEVGRRPRLAVSIRAAGELIGSIWAADIGQPFEGDAHEILAEARQTAALHFVRHATDLRHDASIKDDLVNELLDGSATADVVAIHLGLEPEAPVVIVTFQAVGESPAVNRLRQAITLYCSAYRYVVPLVDRGPRVYAVLPAPDGVTAEVRRFASDAASRAAASVGTRVVAGIGTPADHGGAVPQSRDDADRALRVLLRDPERYGHVVWLPEVLAQATLLELLDVMRERPHLQRSPLAALQTSPRGQPFIEAVRAYLHHFADVRAAAGSLQIHPNTFRYRLKRATQLTGVDLDDADVRLVVALQLQAER